MPADMIEINAKEVELKKAIQSQWITMIAAGLFIAVFVGFFFVPKLHGPGTLIPVGLVALLYIWRSVVIRQAVRNLTQELSQLKQ